MRPWRNSAIRWRVFLSMTVGSSLPGLLAGERNLPQGATADLPPFCCWSRSSLFDVRIPAGRNPSGRGKTWRCGAPISRNATKARSDARMLRTSTNRAFLSPDGRATASVESVGCRAHLADAGEPSGPLLPPRSPDAASLPPPQRSETPPPSPRPAPPRRGVIVYRSGLTKGTGVLSGARRIDVTMSITRIPL